MMSPVNAAPPALSDSPLPPVTDQQILALGYDWVHDRIYYSLFDPTYGIFAMDFDGSNRVKISSDFAYDMVLHPCEGYVIALLSAIYLP